MKASEIIEIINEIDIDYSYHFDDDDIITYQDVERLVKEYRDDIINKLFEKTRTKWG